MAAVEKMISKTVCNVNTKQFWGAVKIYTDKPHILNRRICGTSNLWCGVVTDNYHYMEVLKQVQSILKNSTCADESLICENGVQKADRKEVIDNLNGAGKVNDSLVNKIENKSFNVNSTDQHNLSDIPNNDPSVINKHQKIEPNLAPSDDILKQSNSELEEKKIKDITEILDKSGYKSNETLGDSTTTDESSNPNEDTPNTNEDAPNPNEDAISIPWWRLLEGNECQGLAVIRKTLPRNLKQFVPLLEVVLIDRSRSSVIYIGESPNSGPSIHPRMSYSLSRVDENVCLSILKESNKAEQDKEDPNITWLRKNVLAKVCKWALDVSEDGVVEDRGSICLVNVQEYTQLYQELKIKYGKPLVQMWPEGTDPLKFVYEDVGIATYLLLLWRQERAKTGTTEYQSFVDLGCGNGLLVYILSSEGHPGLGIDLKRRKIWDLFPSNVKLQEGIVEPSDSSLFPAYDWLIGNHSDELTPWIPVIAAKSSENTRFFVLPCCPHDFDCKFRRTRPGMSIYSEYLDYVKKVGAVCGYDIWRDRLRIPSTKRVCFVGQERTVKSKDFPQLYERIKDFVAKRNEANCTALKRINGNTNNSGGGNDLWSTNFKARSSVEAVRNCSQLEKNIKEDLLSTIANIILEKKRIVEILIHGAGPVIWDRGGSISMGDLAKRMSTEQLAALKAQCGGLQTLIKNHKHIFALEKGAVNLQIPRQLSECKVSSDVLRTKPCWFLHYHPQSCPIPHTDCLYSHDMAA